MLLGQWGKFLVLTKIGGYTSKSICFFFLQEEIRLLLLLLFSHPDFFCHFWGFGRCHQWTMGIAFKNKQTKNKKTRSLYVAQAGLKPPVLLPHASPHAGVLDGLHQARQHHLFHPLQSPFPLRCIFPRPCSAHTDFIGGWLAPMQARSWRLLGSGMAFAVQEDRLWHHQLVRNPNPACSCPSWREASIGWGLCTNCPVWSKHLCAVRAHTDSQPVGFHPEMKIAITLLLLHCSSRFLVIFLNWT